MHVGTDPSVDGGIAGESGARDMPRPRAAGERRTPPRGELRLDDGAARLPVAPLRGANRPVSRKRRSAPRPAGDGIAASVRCVSATRPRRRVSPTAGPRRPPASRPRDRRAGRSDCRRARRASDRASRCRAGSTDRRPTGSRAHRCADACAPSASASPHPAAHIARRCCRRRSGRRECGLVLRAGDRRARARARAASRAVPA